LKSGVKREEKKKTKETHRRRKTNSLPKKKSGSQGKTRVMKKAQKPTRSSRKSGPNHRKGGITIKKPEVVGESKLKFREREIGSGEVRSKGGKRRSSQKTPSSFMEEQTWRKPSSTSGSRGENKTCGHRPKKVSVFRMDPWPKRALYVEARKRCPRPTDLRGKSTRL